MLFAFGMKILLGLGMNQTLAKRFEWVPIVVITIILILLVIKIASNWFEQALHTAEEMGFNKAVVEGQTQTLNQLEDANNAEQNLRYSGERNAQRYNECLLDNRDKTRCERFNPGAE